jgi:hypothetical protein
MGHLLRVWAAAFAATALASSYAGAGGCDPARYQIMGNVTDPGGQPIADASVRLLLDQVSLERFAEEGMRARLTRTAGTGAYLALIDCAAARGVTDAPNPCAAKPRHLTVAVEASGFRTKLVAFRLRDLNIVKDAGGCLLQVPEIKLARR